MFRFSKALVISAALTLAAPAAHAQWIKLTTPNIPRTADGKPNMKAPAPQMSGKPDLSGLWRFDSDPYTQNVSVDLKPEEIDPSAVALYKQRMEDLAKDDPATYRCLPPGPRRAGRGDRWARAHQRRRVLGWGRRWWGKRSRKATRRRPAAGASSSDGTSWAPSAAASR